MKLLIFLLVGLLVSLASAGQNLTADFLHGFETGLMVREDKRAFDDYSCPQPQPNSGFLQNALSLVAPLQMMAGLQQDSKIKTIVHQISTFVTTISDMWAVFSEEYDEGDFCRGLIFAKDGANMLHEIAQSFVDEAELEAYNIEKKKQQAKLAADKAK